MKRKTFISCIAPSAPETAGRRLKREAMTLVCALTRRTAAVLAIAVLTATAAWAQDPDPIVTGYTATAGTNGQSGESYDKLVDNSTSTKWCVVHSNDTFNGAYIEFNSNIPFVPTGYVMTTGNDTYINTGRNPKSWVIQAKLNSTDGWTTIATVTDDSSMPTGTEDAPYADGEFTITNTKSYQYFRLEVSAIQSGGVFQLSEFKFRGQFPEEVIHDLQYATISGVEEAYFRTGDEIKPVPTVTDLDGNVLTANTDYTVTWSGDGRTDGTYTITVTGMGSYSGTKTVTYTVSTDINLPATGTKTLNLTEGIEPFKVYDNGGKDGYYSNNCSGSLTINAPTGYVLQLSGSITTEVGRDKLTVYDNNEASGTKLIDGVSSSSSGTQADITTVVSTGQSMTIYFYSDGSVNLAGLDLTVTVVNVSTDFDITTSTVTGGSITADKSQAKVGETVTLTATPDSGYLLDGISVKGAYNNDVAVTDMRWYTGINTATFAMPGSAVTVTPTFTNTLTVEGGLYINMPTTGTKSVTIPSGVQSFKVYDDGGKDGKYSNDCSGTLTLTAPAGYVLRLTGSISTETDDDYLTVYDNSEASGTELLDAVNGGIDIIPVVSTGQSMTLYFHSDESFRYPGLDLTVTVVNASTDFDITISTVTGGSITADKSKAKVGETVTLTATPDSGYLLGGISVKDADNDDVAVTDMRWYTGASSATFVMPGSSVTVTPAFNDLTSLYINMPKTGTMAAIIPSGVKSFKVYDDGGKDGIYSDNCSGTLTLTAPAGYVLQLSGSITTEDKGKDNLTVYDGSEASDTELLDAVSSTRRGTKTAITTVTSTGSVMTLDFYSNSVRNYAGLDLTVTVVKPIELADAADNTEAINGWQNGLANVTLQGRTLFKDGSWNTLCLPFSVSTASGTLSGDNVQAMTLNTETSNLADGTLTLNFDAATTIPAGTPFIIKWDESGTDITNPVFKDVTIDATSHDATVAGVLTFTGTYAPVSIAAGDNTKLYLGAANKLYYPTKAMTIGTHRAYFQLSPGITAGNPTSLVRAFTLNFGDESTGIISVSKESRSGAAPAAWYTLDGRKLDKQPTASGVYIHQGKKVVVK